MVESVFKRIGIIGALANPNFGDDAILEVTLKRIERMYGKNCKIYIFSKDASYSGDRVSDYSMEVVCVDYIHRISLRNHYQVELMEEEGKNLLDTNLRSDNYEYLEIHRIFKQLDVLHIIGGGYLNSMWKDMIYEVYLSCELAKLYHAKILATGISIFPYDLACEKYIEGIFNKCECIDFRDQSYTALPKNMLERYQGKLSFTCDDASMVTINNNLTSGDYLNITFSSGANEESLLTAAETILVPFLKKIIDNRIVNNINILKFAPEDLLIWDQIKESIPENVLEHTHTIDFVEKSFKDCIDIISNAQCNIGTRYHMAVFSLANGVPSYSICVGDYYKNKISEVYRLAKVDEFTTLEELTVDKLYNFIINVPEIREQIRRNVVRIFTPRYQEKLKIIANTYAVNNKEALILTSKVTEESPVKVSVIIPIYNMDRYLQECLDSLRKQTLKDIEIICVNDGSTDYSPSILYENAWKDKRIKVINQVNQGVSAARNHGLIEAVGEYVFFIDPDDWLAGDQVLENLYYAAVNHDTLAAGGQFVEFNTCNNQYITEWHGNQSRYFFKEEKIEQYSDFQFDFGWIRFIYNREFLINNNLFFPDRIYFEDPVWFVKVLSQIKQFYVINQNVYCYRTGYKDFSLSYKQVIDLLKGTLDIIRIAKKEEYVDLLHLEIRRITQEYCREIVKYLGKKNCEEIWNLIDSINAEIVGFYGPEYRIENDIYQWYNSYKCNELSQKCNKLSNQIKEIYSSKTWKLGDIILWLPKTMSKMMSHERKNNA